MTVMLSSVKSCGYKGNSFHMISLELKLYPDPILRKKCEPVEKFTPEIKELISVMLAMMKAKNGIGLAGPQVGAPKQIIVIGAIPNVTEPMGLINPKIIEKGGGKEFGEEGCLSIPGIYEKVGRAKIVEVSGITPEGKKITVDAEDLFARVFQHEIDHLSGVLFPDRMNLLRRIKIYRKYQQIRLPRPSASQ